jgi:hypothetical protein
MVRILFPLAAWIALVIAGMIGGSAGGDPQCSPLRGSSRPR